MNPAEEQLCQEIILVIDRYAKESDITIIQSLVALREVENCLINLIENPEPDTGVKA